MPHFSFSYSILIGPLLGFKLSTSFFLKICGENFKSQLSRTYLFQEVSSYELFILGYRTIFSDMQLFFDRTATVPVFPVPMLLKCTTFCHFNYKQPKNMIFIYATVKYNIIVSYWMSELNVSKIGLLEKSKISGNNVHVSFGAISAFDSATLQITGFRMFPGSENL